MMMSTRQSSRQSAPGGTRRQSGPAVDDGREHISATERWMLISREVYSKAQQRGFVGGDPFGDLSEAARKIDEQYVTDVSGLLSLTDPAEMMDQLRGLFASYGLSRKNLDGLLEKNREAIEKLARLNRSPHKQDVQHVARRKSLLKSTANQAIRALQGFSDEVEDRTRKIPILGGSTQAANSIISNLTRLASSAGDILQPSATESRKQGHSQRKRELEVHGMVVKAYDGLTPAELADAPVAALRGISDASGRKLKSAFGMKSIRDMADSEVFERADGVVTLVDVEGMGHAPAAEGKEKRSPLRELAEGPVHRLEGVTPHQARVLQHTLKINSVRDLAGNRYFRLARAIVSLADAENKSR